jgi:hypothetical protein
LGTCVICAVVYALHQVLAAAADDAGEAAIRSNVLKFFNEGQHAQALDLGALQK